eukprot:EG_transcript_7983
MAPPVGDVVLRLPAGEASAGIPCGRRWLRWGLALGVIIASAGLGTLAPAAAWQQLQGSRLTDPRSLLTSRPSYPQSRTTAVVPAVRRRPASLDGGAASSGNRPARPVRPQWASPSPTGGAALLLGAVAGLLALGRPARLGARPPTAALRPLPLTALLPQSYGGVAGAPGYAQRCPFPPLRTGDGPVPGWRRKSEPETMTTSATASLSVPPFCRRLSVPHPPLPPPPAASAVLLAGLTPSAPAGAPLSVAMAAWTSEVFPPPLGPLLTVPLPEQDLIEEVRRALELDAQVLELMSSTMVKLEDAVVIADLDTKLSVVIGETVAGVLSGLISQRLAMAMKDETAGPAMSAANTGLYFGIRALAKASFWVFGVPRELAILLAPFFGSAATTAFKYAARHLEPAQRVAAKGLGKEVLLVTKQELRSKPSFAWEVSGDAAKWVVYDSIVETAEDRDLLDGRAPMELVTLYSIVGAFAAMWGHVVQEWPALRRGDFWKAHRFWEPQGFGRAMVEGSVMFVTYETSVVLLNIIIPEDVGKAKFWFRQLLDDTLQQAASVVASLPHPPL